MGNIMMKLILLLTLLGGSSAAIPDCEQGKKCPPGGLWGEWTTEGSDVCKQACGSCAEFFQTRTCLSADFSKDFPECVCIGNSSRYIPCNMQACQYPIQRACCVPYVPMVLNGIQSCGPIPKTMREPVTSCCPIGGLWSEWSPGYQNINNQWVRTRRCVSESIGCKCTGSGTIGNANCPCPQPPNAASACPSFPNGFPSVFKNLVVDHSSCTSFLELHNDNDQIPRVRCSSVREFYKNYRFVVFVILDEVEGGCTKNLVSECVYVNGTRFSRATFTCNTETLKWIYDFTGKEINRYVQGEYVKFVDL